MRLVMNRSIRLLTLVGSVALAGCELRDISDTLNPPPADPGLIAGSITQNRILFADTVYTLRGFVKVQNGATLTIQPGTTIVGDPDTPGSSLWILRGARIIAQGTPSQPIVFTSGKPAGSRRRGDWGGIVIVGRGIINRTGATITTEGAAIGQEENYAGGTDNNDNSGVLRYVRIEFAGYDISNGQGQELNALSMYAVGRGTTLEYVQTLNGLDDSFEWWGGAVDGRYLVSYEAGDDHFDWTEGYQGRNQYLIALQTIYAATIPGVGAGSADPRGFEGDGCDPVPGSGCFVTNTTSGSTTAGTSTPYSMPIFANFTIIGPGTGVAGFPADGNGAVLRRGTAGFFTNGIIGRWPGRGVQIRDAFTDSLRLRDSLQIVNLILAENGPAASPTPYDAAGADLTGSESARRFAQQSKFATANHRVETSVAALVASLNTGSLDWTATGAAATGGGQRTIPAARTTNFFGGTLTNTSFVGAGQPGGLKWWQGWTTYLAN
jgi:hypothetical protein